MQYISIGKLQHSIVSVYSGEAMPSIVIVNNLSRWWCKLYRAPPSLNQNDDSLSKPENLKRRKEKAEEIEDGKRE